jgi:hypothetical protein
MVVLGMWDMRQEGIGVSARSSSTVTPLGPPKLLAPLSGGLSPVEPGRKIIVVVENSLAGRILALRSEPSLFV